MPVGGESLEVGAPTEESTPVDTLDLVPFEGIAPFDGEQQDHKISNDDICGSNYFDANTGVVSIDIGSSVGVGANATLTIGDGGQAPCAEEIKRVEITRTGAGGYENLVIADNTFCQSTPGGGSNALVSVSFPDGLDSLEIGDYAFSQYAGSGGNALESVSFPEGLGSLEIGDYAFSQFAGGGGNALAEVVFPASVHTLKVGEKAFYQETWSGGSNALVSVVFPEELEKLDIGEKAFFLEDSPEGLVLFFPFDGEALPDPLVLGADVTRGSGVGGSAWVWLGDSETGTGTAWGTANSYALFGALSAEVVPNGGVLPSDDSERLFVFPAVDDKPQVAPLSGVAGLSAAGFRDGTEFLLAFPDFPEASPAEGWGESASLAGWCGGSWEDGACGSGLLNTDEPTKLEPGSPYTFAAVWEATPVAPSLTDASCEAARTVDPAAVDGLFVYEMTPVDGGVEVTAEPADYVSLAGQLSWSFEVSLVSFRVSFDLDGGAGDGFEAVTVYKQGCSIELPSASPSMEGFTFKGWKVQGSENLLQAGASYTVSGDVEFVAQWEKNASVTPPGGDIDKPGTDKPGQPGGVDKPSRPVAVVTPGADSPGKVAAAELSNTGGSALPFGIGALFLLATGGGILAYRKRTH